MIVVLKCLNRFYVAIHKNLAPTNGTSSMSDSAAVIGPKNPDDRQSPTTKYARLDLSICNFDPHLRIIHINDTLGSHISE